MTNIKCGCVFDSHYLISFVILVIAYTTGMNHLKRSCQIWLSANNPIVTANDFIPKCEISATIRTINICDEKIRRLRFETLKCEAE